MLLTGSIITRVLRVLLDIQIENFRAGLNINYTAEGKERLGLTVVG